MSGSKRRVIESDSSSDSDDDIPLSKLRADARAGIDITIKAEPRAVSVTPDAAIKKDDPAPEVSVKREPNGESAKKKAPVESDSDDDMPISGLRKKIKVEVKRESAAAPSAASRSTSSIYGARMPTRTKKRVIKIKYKQQECTEELYQTLKGRLTQELLCRWWYAIEWPPVKAKEAELDGFRGAYIRVKGDEMGSIVDTRTPIGKPSFLHFFAMPSAEIQKLLVKAYEKQMQVLIEHEGEDAPLLKELRSAKASAERISPEKADRSVVKVLKGYKELAEQLKEIEERAMKEENTATEEDEDEDGDDDDDDE
uniref:Uncharacterized protein n=1 Tax=Globisporangium ultimum (strain ATCC 200006 / CBS 805.95 / DAOM BR144) TaxID=431595 RepID=K3WSU4_GLOUD